MLKIMVGAVGAVMLTASAAFAAPVIGNSNASTFSNLTNCNNPATCFITNDGGQGSNSRVEWGEGSGRDPSTLTAQDRSFNVNTPADDVIIAELRWFNNDTRDSQTDDQFNVSYNLQVNFTTPVGVASTVIPLTITNTDNPTGDQIQSLTLASLAGLTFSLPGIVVSDLKWVLNSQYGGSLSGGVWYNPEDNTSKMYITADFRVQETPVSVPEPASLALLGIGLIGLGATRRRMKRATA